MPPIPLETPIFWSAVNFSEGRRRAVLEALAEAIRQTPDAYLIHYSADYDHNRSVFTLLGDAEPLRAALRAAVVVALREINLRTHQGVHPRAGAIDVVPVVPARYVGRPEAVALAERIGQEVAAQGIPVYFYEWSARRERATLPELRRGGFEALASSPLEGDRAPDLGGNRVHPSAGICVVGARPPLVAYNINLNTNDVQIARAIAKRIRQERDRRPELTGVRALGLHLATPDVAQVSMNLTRPERTPLPAVFAYVQAAAQELGAMAKESELIGAIPRASLGGQPPSAIRWNAYDPAQLLETWLDA